MSSQARETKAKINKWDYIKPKQTNKQTKKPKPFCTMKETTNKVKREPPEGEKIFVNHISKKRFIF